MIRRARLEDAPRLAELATQLGYPTDAPAMARRLEVSEGAVLVAEEGAQVAGFVHVVPWRGPTSAGEARIRGLVVAEDARGRGLGSRLVEAAEAWARGRGHAVIAVAARIERARTHDFYERAGYEVVKTQKVFRKQLALADERGAPAGGHRVSIEYCTQCRWLLRAAWMAQELLTTFSGELGEVALTPGTGGVFDVRVDGAVVFSRAQERRFPESKELKQRVRDRVAPERDLGHSDR